jgi:hypothetical protein
MKTLNDDFPPLAAVKTEPAPGLKLLREPFPAHQISKLPKPTKKQTEDVRANFKLGIRCAICGAWHHPDVIHLDYVGHAALTDRLLDADPAWYWEPLATDSSGLPSLDESGGMWIKLTVCGVTRLGYGDAQGKTGGDAMKERIGDALRNAAMRFGAALDLWHKGDLHLPEDDKLSAEDFEWAEQQAMAVRVMFGKGDIEGASAHLETLGEGGSYDAEAKEVVWGRLADDTRMRSTIKAYEVIAKAADLPSLIVAFEAAPKHAKDALKPYASKRKAELSALVVEVAA